MIRPPSFFDDEAGKLLKKIFIKPPKEKDSFEKLHHILAQGCFLKKCKSKDKAKSRFYCIDEDYLYYFKADKPTKLAGVLDLTCVKYELAQGVEGSTVDKDCKQMLNGFKLSRNLKGFEIYTPDASMYKHWKNVLMYRAIQTTFHEEFLVTKMIGKGSFAKVYLATKKETGISYAIKAFNKEYMSQQHKGKESLINEISIMRHLNNEHLLHLYEVYETTNSIYFVVDLVNGGELLHRIREKGHLTESNLKALIRNLLQALEHLHNKNIMHRDLKPENLLLKSKESDSEIIMADFGLATFTNIPEILFKRCGTPGFVAPEVLMYKEGDPFYDLKCDIFSAGIIFYLLLTGKQPFQGKDYKAILRANKACEISFDTPELQKISASAKDLLVKMLEKNPATRLTAQQCLHHPFLQNDISSPTHNLESNQNLRSYDYEFLVNLKTNKVDSQELVGSLQLQTNQPILTGRTDTAGSLSNYSNSSISKLEQKIDKQPPQASIFGRKNTNEMKDQENQGQLSGSKKSNQKDLHKQAIKNSLLKQYQQEERKKDEQEGDFSGNENSSDQPSDDSPPYDNKKKDKVQSPDIKQPDNAVDKQPTKK